MVFSFVMAADAIEDVRSLRSRGHASDTRVERSATIAFGHLGQWDHRDLGRMARRTELFEPLAAEIAHRIHRWLEEFARVEFAPGLGCYLSECRGHRQPAIGVDVDLADAMPDAAHDFLDRHAPGLRHLAAELIENILQWLRHRR